MIDLLLVSGIILFCALIGRVTHKLGVPVLLAFVCLGMLVGENGIFQIAFDDYELTAFICEVSLIFIMFYGGFGTSWNHAKPVVLKASVLASLGIILTTAFTGFVCITLFNMPTLEAFLLGAVLSSTDAASVFSVLRSKNLGLKENTASLLEMESGSNDPFAYMLTIIILTMMNSQASGFGLLEIAAKQLFFGALFGGIIAFGVGKFLKHYKFPIVGFDMAFMIGIALLAYALPTTFGGNGYLSVYIAGIALGNCHLKEKKTLVTFFDGFTSLTQMLIFFLLGFLATPSLIPQVLTTSILIALLLAFVIRPLAVTLCLTPFRCSLPQQLLVSFAGLRGAASVIFAIVATVNEVETPGNLYHMVFCIVLLSISFQGSLLAPVARLLGMCDDSIDDSKSFSDYAESNRIGFVSLPIHEGHPWINKALHEVHIPPGMLVIMILREGKNVLHGGSTLLCIDDTIILCAPKNQEEITSSLSEYYVNEHSEFIGKSIASTVEHGKRLVVMILRNGRTIIPSGKTIIEVDDLLVVMEEDVL